MTPGSCNRVTNEQYRVVWESRQELRSKVAELETKLRTLSIYWAEQAEKREGIGMGSWARDATMHGIGIDTARGQMKQLGLTGLGEGGDAS